MKKSLILFLIAFATIYFGYFINQHFLGMVYYKESSNKDPKNWFSKLMKDLDQPDSMKIASLDKINHIVINHSSKFNSVRIVPNQQNNLSIQSGKTNYAFDRTIINDTLSINLNDKNYLEIIIFLDQEHQPSLIFNESHATVMFENIPEDFKGLSSIYAKNESTIDINKAFYQQNSVINSLSLYADSKSKFSIRNITANKLNAKLDNGMIDYYKECDIDSIQAELIGLSHIRGLKNEGKFKDIKLSGDLSYYNSHP